ncbi:AMP-binding protein [Streptosporangium sp. NPDC002607]
MTLTRLLDERARRHPAKVFLRTREGDLSYAEFHERSRALSAGLAALGVRPGEPVAVLMRNSADAVLTWFAVARLGAVHVPVNTSLIGSGLAHAFQVTRARVTVVDAELLPALAALPHEPSGLEAILVRGAGDALPTWHGTARVARFERAALPGVAVAPAETGALAPAMMLFTSGTTGPSKACVLSNRYLVRQGELHAENLRLTAEDVLYCPFPLFHIDAATLTVVAALSVGAVAAIGAGFSASGFWDEVRRFDATVFNFMGATLTILWKRPPRPDDRAHRVRLAWGVPMPAWRDGWEQRFGFPLLEVYGLTDGGVPVYEPLDAPRRPGSCGRVISQYELAIGGEDGSPLPPGEIGEILIRPREPGLVMNSYHGMPEATAAAFHGEWLRTGDLGRLDEDGHLYFCGRAKDGIRRRGENISAYEVEQVVEGHPSVLEAAAVGVPSELTEEDLKVCVVLRPGASLTAEELTEHCTRHAAPHMVPRYVEFLDLLPKTPTQKVEKFQLRQAGITPATWDREAARPGTRARPGAGDLVAENFGGP